MKGDGEYLLKCADLPLVVRRSLAGAAVIPEAEPFPAGFFQQPPQPAAVLMPLVHDGGHWRLLFIRRARHDGDRHSGQVAFPGGQVDAADASAEAAALREAEEEIGLRPDNVMLLGRLGPYHTVSNYKVTPVVGHIEKPFAPVPDPREVDRVFSIPLAWLVDPANLEHRSRQLPGTNAAIDVLYYRPYQGELLWGVTARLVKALLDRITGAD